MMTQMSLIFTILMLPAVKADGQTCRFGRSGAGCRYNCNCAGNCDSQTGCAGNCAASWDGPTCQRRNVALHQMTYQSSDYNDSNRFYTSEFAVDGKVGHILDRTPCTHTQLGSRGWWGVTLDRTYSIYTFQIYNRVRNCDDGNGPKPCGSRLNGFTLSVGANNQSYTTCYTDTTTTDEGPGDIINGRCNDGNPRTGNTVQLSLPLGSSTPLTLCEVRLFVCSEGWYGEMCDKECVTDTCCSRCDDHGLRCEKCVNGRWHTECGEECGHCSNNTACNKDTSECPNLSPRCESGFQGYNCRTNCSSYTWGPDCKETCGQCHGGAVCDGVSGDCPLENPRCAIGYTGSRCESCQPGLWGDNCVRTCSEYCFEQPCNAQTGACEEGCQPGHAGKFCEIKFTVDYTNVIIGCVVGVILAAALITLSVVLWVKRRQPGQSQGPAASAENTAVTHDVSHPDVPNRTREPWTDPVTYYNMITDDEHPYETVPEKEYDKIRSSRLGTEAETNYTTLT